MNLSFWIFHRRRKRKKTTTFHSSVRLILLNPHHFPSFVWHTRHRILQTFLRCVFFLSVRILENALSLRENKSTKKSQVGKSRTRHICSWNLMIGGFVIGANAHSKHISSPLVRARWLYWPSIPSFDFFVCFHFVSCKIPNRVDYS